jgi:hypothetical protein
VAAATVVGHLRGWGSSGPADISRAAGCGWRFSSHGSLFFFIGALEIQLRTAQGALDDGVLAFPMEEKSSSRRT